MSSRNLIKTKYPGVYYYDTTGKNGKSDRRYVILYRRRMPGAKLINEPIGYASQGMTPAKASEIRSNRISGKELNNKEKREKIKNEKLNEENRLTYNKLFERYCEEFEGQASLRSDVCRYNKHICNYIGSKNPIEITQNDIEKIRQHLINCSLSAQTIKNTLELVRRILNYGQKKGLYTLAYNINFQMPKIDNQKTEMMDSNQLAAYLKALDEEPDQNAAAALRLALVTGIRKGALLALEWKDIDFERNIITLRGETAKKGSTSHIPLTESAKNILLTLAREGAYLFPGQKGGHRIDIKRIAKRVRDKAGLKDFRPMHGLRHAYASALASSGKVDLYTLQKLLTHESPQMTQRYAHLADEAKKRAASVIDDIISQALSGE